MDISGISQNIPPLELNQSEIHYHSESNISTPRSSRIKLQKEISEIKLKKTERKNIF